MVLLQLQARYLFYCKHFPPSTCCEILSSKFQLFFLETQGNLLCWLGLTREASSSSCLNATCDGEATWADGTEFAFDEDLVNTVHFSAKNERACARIIQVDPKTSAKKQ